MLVPPTLQPKAVQELIRRQQEASRIIGTSAAQQIVNTGEIVRDPASVIDGLVELAKGGVHKFTPGIQPQEQLIDIAGQQVPGS